MARLNSKKSLAAEKEFQPLIIEDSWEGSIYLEARLIRTWQGLCSSNKLLEDRDGHFYWWAVFYALEGGEPLQRLVSFLDWDSMATELGISENEGRDTGMLTSYMH
jgi:hypothetical protein